MSRTDKGRASNSTAEIYDEFYVPAVFEQWADSVADAAQIGTGQRVLEVASGTGALARSIAKRVGESGSVVGFDKSPEMLAVARRKHLKRAIL